MSSSGGSRGGSTVSQGTSGSRPAATPNALRYETDTGEWLVATPTGSAWQSLFSTQSANAWGCNGILYHNLGNFAYQLTRDGGTGLSLFGNDIEVPGIVDVTLLGAGVRIKEGANGKQQVCGPMVAGSVVVANTSVTANSRIYPMRGPGGTNPGAWTVSAISAGVSFTIVSTNAADTGSGWYTINEPG